MKNIIISIAACGVLALGAAACGDDDDSGSADASTGGGGDLSGTIKIDGSSTVAPFAQAAQEAFQAENPNEEVPVCKKAGIDYEDIQVANDGIAVVTNPDLKVDCLTADQLKQLWNQGSKVKSLSELDPKLPDTELSLFGPGTDSGTFDFFTEQINGEEGVSREDYQPSEDDNVLVQGVEGESGGLGYFGHSYYEQNQDKLNLLKVDGGDGCVEPTTETIQSGEYKPLSRPLFMYPSTKALKRPEVKAFLDYVIDNYQPIAEASQIVPMSTEQADKSKAALGS